MAVQWQSYMSNWKQRIDRLYETRNLSDIIIKFARSDVFYAAHKLVLASCSPVFEGIFYGPMSMRIHSDILELQDDDDPDTFSLLLKHCYDVSIGQVILEDALNLYKMADKYLLDELKNISRKRVRRLLSEENMDQVVEFCKRFNYQQLMVSCFAACSTLSAFRRSSSAHFIDSEILLSLDVANLRNMLHAEPMISCLAFRNSWRYPSKVLSDEKLDDIMRSEHCKLGYFSGCISSKSLAQVLTHLKSPAAELYLSLYDPRQAKSVINYLNNINISNLSKLAINIPFESGISPNDLSRLPLHKKQPTIFISGLSDAGIKWAVGIASVLSPANGPSYIKLTRSKLTIRGCKQLVLSLVSSVPEGFLGLTICSPQLPPGYPINKWAHSNLRRPPAIVFKPTDDTIVGW